MNETHSAIAILELLRILVDEEKVDWKKAWNVVVHTFSCGFYTIKESQMEKWPVEMMAKLLPRHLELVLLINKIMIDKVKSVFPKDYEKRVENMSLIDNSDPKQIRMANLCIISCHKIVLSSELQQEILTTSVFKDFHEFLPKTFVLIPNGANPRRWIHNANRELSKLITEELQEDESEWLVDLDRLKPL